MAELITEEMIEVYAVTGTWSDIGARRYRPPQALARRE
jgi:hypothetical protein